MKNGFGIGSISTSDSEILKFEFWSSGTFTSGVLRFFLNIDFLYFAICISRLVGEDNVKILKTENGRKSIFGPLNM